MAHRPFTDRAGYTRHCWECKHAQEWDEDLAECWLLGVDVTYLGNPAPALVRKTDSPNNQCSRAAGCEYYER